MSIIVLTPPPKNPRTANTDTTATERMASEFLHLIGREGYHFESFEQLRDFAQAQIDADAAVAAPTPPPAA